MPQPGALTVLAPLLAGAGPLLGQLPSTRPTPAALPAACPQAKFYAKGGNRKVVDSIIDSRQ